MPRPKKSTSAAPAGGNCPLGQCQHVRKTRANNSPVGLVDAASGSNAAQARAYAYVPFELGEHRRVAVKIVDDRGIESLKIVHVVSYDEDMAMQKANKP